MHGKIFVERNKLSSCLVIETRGFHVATKFSRTFFDRPRVLACKSWRTTQTCSTTTNAVLSSKLLKISIATCCTEQSTRWLVYTSELTCWCPLWYVHVNWWYKSFCVSFAFYAQSISNCYAKHFKHPQLQGISFSISILILTHYIIEYVPLVYNESLSDCLV